jgi:hypothetical protein
MKFQSRLKHNCWRASGLRGHTEASIFFESIVSATAFPGPRKFPNVIPAAVIALDSRKPLREIVIYCFPV